MSPTKKTAIVLGASGFIGQGVANALSRGGYSTYGLVRNPQKGTKLAQEEVSPIIGSIGNPQEWVTKLNPSVTFNLIVTCTDRSDPNQSPDDYGTQLLTTIDLLVKHYWRSNPKATEKPLLIFTSGNLMYGDGGRVGEEGFRGFSEPDPFRPYPGAEFRVKVIKELLGRDDLWTTVVLPSYLYGHSGSYYAPIFAQAKVKGGVIKVTGTPGTVRHGIHVDDLAAAYVLLAGSSPQTVHGEYWNVAGDKWDTLEEIMKAASAEFGGGHRLEFDGDTGQSFGGISNWLKSDKIRSRLGWAPKKPGVIEGMKVYIAAWAAHQQ